MPKTKVNSSVFVYNDSHLSLKHQNAITNVLGLISLEGDQFSDGPVHSQSCKSLC